MRAYGWIGGLALGTIALSYTQAERFMAWLIPIQPIDFDALTAAILEPDKTEAEG